MFTRAFWKDTAERAISTAAQAAIGLLSADGLGVLDVDWGDVGSVSGLAALIAVLKALVASRVNDPESASFVELDTPGQHAADRHDPNLRA